MATFGVTLGVSWQHLGAPSPRYLISVFGWCFGGSSHMVRGHLASPKCVHAATAPRHPEAPNVAKSWPKGPNGSLLGALWGPLELILCPLVAGLALSVPWFIELVDLAHASDQIVKQRSLVHELQTGIACFWPSRLPDGPARIHLPCLRDFPACTSVL